MASSPASAPTILVTGATGNIGTELTKLLAAQGVPFRAMVRNPHDQPAQALRALPGAEVVAGDFNDAASLDRALAGIERAFLLTNSTAQAEAQQLSFVAAARQAGVHHLVKQSQWAAAAGSPVRFLRYHAAVEQAIRASGLAYTFLRPKPVHAGAASLQRCHSDEAAVICPHWGGPHQRRGRARHCRRCRCRPDRQRPTPTKPTT